MNDITESLRELLLARAEGRIDSEEFERRQAALHAELLAAPSKSASIVWRCALITAITAVVVAAGLYLWLDKAAPERALPSLTGSASTPPMTAMPKGPARPGSGGDLKVMAGRLAEKLTKDPANAEGWALLGQTYVEIGQFKLADQAFAKAAALRPRDAKLLADWADAHVVGNGRHWDKRARELVVRALAADPKQLKALALAGSAAFDRHDYKKAIGYWKKMRAAAPAGSMDVKLADANIAEATAVMTGKRPAPAADTPPPRRPPRTSPAR
jgi:cytochrome c-type biogenesis protein CcmH